MVHVGDRPFSQEEIDGDYLVGQAPVEEYAGDVRWPEKCDHCEYKFTDEDARQVFNERRWDTPSGALEPGCLYWARWFPDDWPFVGNRAVCPNGEVWDVDSRAANCTMPEDREHRCWVRHGDPPMVTVDKNGRTCQAGGGSIIAGDYHGFLQNGEFT